MTGSPARRAQVAAMLIQVATARSIQLADSRYPAPRTVWIRLSCRDGSSALRSRRMCTSTVRSSTNTWSPTPGQELRTGVHALGVRHEKCSSRNSVGPRCT